MEKWSLTALADGLLRCALNASDGRGIRTVDGGRPHLLQQTVIALAKGQRLDEHENPGEATVQVLRGRVRVSAGDDTTDGSPGQLLILPGARHTLTALEDAVLLRTVAKRVPSSAADAADTDPSASYQPQPQRRHRRWPVNAPQPAAVQRPITGRGGAGVGVSDSSRDRTTGHRSPIWRHR
jgi:quercetin dioxygenase-like cupin family protein